MNFLLRALLSVGLLSLVCACSDGGSDSEDSGSSELSINTSKSSIATNEAGDVAFTFAVKAGDTSVQVSLSGASYYQLMSINTPDNKKIDENFGLQGYTAAALQANPFIVNIPLTTEGLTPGNYTVNVQIKDSRGRDVGGVQELTATTLVKQDSSPSSGTLKVNLILYGPTSNSEELRAGLEVALENWREMYGRVGISLDTKWYDFEGGATLPDPRAGHPIYETISEATRAEAVNIIFASDVAGLGGEARFGLTSRAPSPAFPSARSAVAISILSVAGTDGRLDDDSRISVERHSDEVRLAAEVMAQLTSHYLGLDYVVQFSGNRVTADDNLNDTASCLTLTDCRLNGDARSNLMFPIPVRKFTDVSEVNEANEFYARDQLTGQQSIVLNSSILVD